MAPHLFLPLLLLSLFVLASASPSAPPDEGEYIFSWSWISVFNHWAWVSDSYSRLNQNLHLIALHVSVSYISLVMHTVSDEWNSLNLALISYYKLILEHFSIRLIRFCICIVWLYLSCLIDWVVGYDIKCLYVFGRLAYYFNSPTKKQEWCL